MNVPNSAPRIAVLDDYQGVALQMADWSEVRRRAMLDVFTDHLGAADEVVARLLPYEVLCVMRERTPLPRDVLTRLPNLRLIVSTGPRNASIDTAAAAARGVQIAHTGYTSTPTVELTWALILAATRHLVAEAASLRAGGWQRSVGEDLAGRTLGIIGLGSVGSLVARVAHAFGMTVIAWSQNLTEERAAAAGARLVSKERLLRDADVVSLHLVLSERTRGLMGAAEFALMKPTARLVNTSRGPLVSETALLEALKNRTIVGASIDVYDVEPLPAGHPYRSAEHLLATPHIGYVSRGLYEKFYADTVAKVTAWLDAT